MVPVPLWIKRRVRNNSSRVHLARFVDEAGRSVPAGARVLDAGAGDEIYRDSFAHADYESADFLQVDKPYAKVDYVCDLTEIPVEDARFDLVLLTQVLEHLPEPAAVLRELHRVLKEDGKLWLSAPLFYEEHEVPYDFYRYTQFGLRYLLEHAGFDVERLEWLEGYLGTLSYQFWRAFQSLPTAASAYGGGLSGAVFALLAWPVKLALLILASILGRIDAKVPYLQGGYPKYYCVVARKRSIPEPYGASAD